LTFKFLRTSNLYKRVEIVIRKLGRTAKKTARASGKNPLSAFKQEDALKRLLKDLLFLAAKVALIALVFMLLFTFVFGIVRYGEPSMTPAIKDGDLVIYNRYVQSGYQPRDAVVLEIDGLTHVRRVVAGAGDIVDITEEGLLINGSLQQEPEIYQKTERYQEGGEFPLTVPEGQVFVLGDSRSGATDSRIYGCVEISGTKGKVMTVIRLRGI